MARLKVRVEFSSRVKLGHKKSRGYVHINKKSDSCVWVVRQEESEMDH